MLKQLAQGKSLELVHYWKRDMLLTALQFPPWQNMPWQCSRAYIDDRDW